jgi:UrcA family protein
MLRIVLSSLIATALVPATAFAKPDEVEVRYKDLDLGTEAGQATLDRRIASAANQACQAATTTGSRIAAAQIERECKQGVRRQVEEQIGKERGRMARN